MPVAYQTGVVPTDAKSLLIQVAPHSSVADGYEPFTLRLHCYRVEMAPIGIIEATTIDDSSYHAELAINQRDIRDGRPTTLFSRAVVNA